MPKPNKKSIKKSKNSSTKTTKKKKKLTNKKSKARPAYLREVEIRFKKKQVSGGSTPGKPLTDSRQVFELFKDLENENKEKLVAISVDAKLKIIAFEVVAIGSVASIWARPFEALRAAIPLNALGLFIVHNHPSGDPTPSKQDKTFTKKLARICDDGGMEFHDHIIIGDNSYFSFADESLM